MSTKSKIQKVRVEIEAHEGRGWLKGYEDGLAVREQETVTLQNALEARNERIRELRDAVKSRNDQIQKLSTQNNGPTTAREALKMAWELAYPVNSGDVIPKDMTCLQDKGDRITMNSLPTNWTPAFPESVRTIDPLPESEPYWLDALAVLAHTEDEEPHVWIARGTGEWRDEHGNTRHWKDLKDVNPLYQLDKTTITHNNDGTI